MTTGRPNCHQCDKPMAVMGPRTAAGLIRWRCSRCMISTTGTPQAAIGAGYDQAAVDARHEQLRLAIKAGTRRFVVTAAQNNTRVHAGFLASLEQYCKANDAELIVIPVHYKNISLFTAGQEYRKRWADAVAPYLVDKELVLGGRVVVQAGLKIAATAARPISGTEPIGGRRWQIIGHGKQLMQPVATPGDELPKRIYTTGAVTRKNYSRTKEGAKAEFHHVIGALVVEVATRGYSFVRQINAEPSGAFYDLDSHYTPDGATSGHPVAVLTPGDEHVVHQDQRVRRATYTAPDSIASVLRPEMIVRHDVLDGYAGSHHHEKDDVVRFRKHHAGLDDYRAELDATVAHINATTAPGCVSLIVDSNHHNHLDKWLANVDPRHDPRNALLIHELKAAQYQAALDGKTVSAFRLYAEPRLDCLHRWLDPNKPHLVGDVDYSQHGDRGPNGSRGSARSLAKSTYKMVIGHSHGARIDDGVYQVGTSTDRLEYEHGLSDHTNTHCIQYQNGRRTLIDIINGRWRLN